MSICVKFGLLCDIVEMFGCYFEVCEILFYVEEQLVGVLYIGFWVDGYLVLLIVMFDVDVFVVFEWVDVDW